MFILLKHILKLGIREFNLDFFLACARDHLHSSNDFLSMFYQLPSNALWLKIWFVNLEYSNSRRGDI